jgi:pimeloyl-ACP methyl ester carboxylesterase
VAHAQVNGASLYYELSGSGPPLVFVHGSWGDHHNWDRVVPAFAESFTVLAYDRRGHSASTAPEGQGSVRDDVADLAALIEGLELAPANVAGNSWGAAIALRLASQRPDLFRRLVAHEPPLFGLLEDDPASGPTLELVAANIGAVEQKLAAGEHEAGARHFVEEIAFGPGAWAELPEEVQRTFVRNAPTFLDECRDPDQIVLDLEPLQGFAHPALLSQGELSAEHFARVVAMLASALPVVQRVTFAGAGHVPHLTHPDEYVAVVGGFLRQAPG